MRVRNNNKPVRWQHGLYRVCLQYLMYMALRIASLFQYSHSISYYAIIYISTVYIQIRAIAGPLFVCLPVIRPITSYSSGYSIRPAGMTAGIL